MWAFLCGRDSAAAADPWCAGYRGCATASEATGAHLRHLTSIFLQRRTKLQDTHTHTHLALHWPINKQQVTGLAEMAPLSPRRRCFILLCLAAVHISHAAVQVRVIYYSVLFLMTSTLSQKSCLCISSTWISSVCDSNVLIIRKSHSDKLCSWSLIPSPSRLLWLAVFFFTVLVLPQNLHKCDSVALIWSLWNQQPSKWVYLELNVLWTGQILLDNAGIYGMLHRQFVPMNMWLIKPSGRIRGTFSSWGGL